MDFNNQIELLKQALENVFTFDNEQDKTDCVLDIVNEFKRLYNENLKKDMIC